MFSHVGTFLWKIVITSNIQRNLVNSSMTPIYKKSPDFYLCGWGEIKQAAGDKHDQKTIILEERILRKKDGSGDTYYLTERNAEYLLYFI